MGRCPDTGLGGAPAPARCARASGAPLPSSLALVLALASACGAPRASDASVGGAAPPAAAPEGPPSAPPSVALIDTAVDLRAPELAACSAPGAPGCPILEAVRIGSAGSDDSGHGTNLAAVVVRAGVPVVSLDVFEHEVATFDAVVAAIEWSVAHRDRYGIRVLNVSLGEGVARSLCAAEPLAVALDAAVKAGLVAVVAAGDEAYTEALAVPACAPAALSVGALDGDAVASFSNSAPFLTLLAPGVDVTAGGKTFSGTSQAAAFVSAAAARLLRSFPEDGAGAVRTRLVSQGTPVRDLRNGVVTPSLSVPSAVPASIPQELRP